MTVTEVLKSRKSVVITSLSKSCKDDPSTLEYKLASACRTYVQNITVVLCLSDGDMSVRENSVRLFAKRRQCKGQLVVGKEYLIMGKDGSTTDSSGM